MIELPALSIRQPWAWAILHSGKPVENRNWATRFRGRFLIHAGVRFDSAIDDDWIDYVMRSAVRLGMKKSEVPAADDIPRGGIVGVAEIVDCVERYDSPWFFGRYGFVLTNARPLPFHPCKGRLGFFKVEYPHEVPE